ncbi:MAG: AAA family ATPase [Campylobacterota bacterium]|nr:AAA family ATPase [Campylobacterota bacterium]
MSKEIAHFQNFAKLKDTKVEFNDITVLAGKPSTGKSYVMKFMYAVKERSYQNNLTPLIAVLGAIGLDNLIDNLIQDESLRKNLKYLSKSEQYNELEKLIKDYFTNQNSSQATISNLDFFLTAIQNKRISKSTQNKNEYYLDNIIKSIFGSHKQISNEYKVTYNDEELSYENEKLNIKKENSNIIKLGRLEPIFVETPLILEFKKFMNREKGKTPYHIESLLNILDTDYSFTDEEQDKFIQEFTQKSKAIINGNVESSGDSFVFKTDSKDYDILNASSGIKSIGLLQYLVTNKALKKGSILFWEEPEVHLHPKWQLKMVDLFVELMNAGVKIVFSTHSPYMADYLNAISQKGEFRDRVSFNLLQESDGVVENRILEDNEDWNQIQAELLDPLEEIMWEYI